MTKKNNATGQELYDKIEIDAALALKQDATQSLTLGTTESVTKFQTTALSQTIVNWLLQIGQKINGLIEALSTTLTNTAGASTLPTTSKSTIASLLQTVRNCLRWITEILSGGTNGQLLSSAGTGTPKWADNINVGNSYALTSSNELIIARMGVYNTGGWYDAGDLNASFVLDGIEYQVSAHFNNTINAALASDGFQGIYGISPSLPANLDIYLLCRWRGTTYAGGHFYDLSLRSSVSRTVTCRRNASCSYVGWDSGGSTSLAKYAVLTGNIPLLSSSRYTTKAYKPSNINDI